MDSSNKENDSTNQNHYSNDSDWHEQLLQLNTDVAMDFVKQNLDIHNMESCCNAMEEELIEFKLEVTKLEGDVTLKEQELSSLLEKEKLLSEHLQTENEMVESKEYIDELIQENQRLLKAKHERYNKEANEVIKKYEEHYKQLQNKYEMKPLAQQRRKLQIEVQKERIHLAILKQNLEEQKEQNKLLRQIRKRQEQVKIIKFAQVMLEYYEMEKIKEEIKDYEQKFEKMEKNKKAQSEKENKIDLRHSNFKIPESKSFSTENKQNSMPFKIPNINLSAYKINNQQFTSDNTYSEGLNSGFTSSPNYLRYTSGNSMLSTLNMNKRNASYSPQRKQKMMKLFNLNQSVPLQRSLPELKMPEISITPVKSSNEMFCKRSKVNTPKILSQENRTKNVSQSNKNCSQTNSIEENPIKEKGISENITTFPHELKSSYFLSSNSVSTEQQSVSGLSQIISSCSTNAATVTSQMEKVLDTSDEQDQSVMDYQYKQHDLDIMETNSIVSCEEFTSPTGPLTDVENISEQPGNETFSFVNIFGGVPATAPQTNTNNSEFCFLNNSLNTPPSRKKSSQNIFSMF